MDGNRNVSMYLLFVLCALELSQGCSRYWEYIPKKSSAYRIEENKIKYADSDIDLAISGVYALSGGYLASFRISMQSLKDTLYASFPQATLVADSIPRETRFIKYFSGDVDENTRITILPNREQQIEVRFEVLGVNPRDPKDAFSEVTLDWHSILQRHGKYIELPEFHFVAKKE